MQYVFASKVMSCAIELQNVSRCIRTTQQLIISIARARLLKKKLLHSEVARENLVLAYHFYLAITNFLLRFKSPLEILKKYIPGLISLMEILTSL